jgi:hypothetical protein
LRVLRQKFHRFLKEALADPVIGRPPIDVLAHRQMQPSIGRENSPLIPFIAIEVNDGVFPRKLFDDLHAVIGRAVVNDDDL